MQACLVFIALASRCLSERRAYRRCCKKWMCNSRQSMAFLTQPAWSLHMNLSGPLALVLQLRQTMHRQHTKASAISSNRKHPKKLPTAFVSNTVALRMPRMLQTFRLSLILTVSWWEVRRSSRSLRTSWQQSATLRLDGAKVHSIFSDSFLEKKRSSAIDEERVSLKTDSALWQQSTVLRLEGPHCIQFSVIILGNKTQLCNR
mmetsp:Transcript_8319/g.15740  ORF Transcript_8319/g.15740 Transcript_8319/m.15740 type:complete len:203 (+) Transcript_8319:442-1050(+)